MLKKNVRIIIADRRHEHRLYIEKLLNTLGYFRIVSVSSLEEAWTLTQIDTCPVGLLIINESLLGADPFNHLDHPQTVMSACASDDYREARPAPVLLA